MAKIKLAEIEKSIYGDGGLFQRVIEKVEKIGSGEACKLTGKKRQYIDLIRRQYHNPGNFDYRPKLDTIKNIAEKLGVE
jgi:hypothetical protein